MSRMAWRHAAACSVLLLSACLCLTACAGDTATSGDRDSSGPGPFNNPKPTAGAGGAAGTDLSSHPMQGGMAGRPMMMAGSGMMPVTTPGSSREPISLDECGANNPGGLSPEAVQKAQAGGGSALRLVYPYDGTVFPRGILAPVLMWEGEPGDAVYVHIKAQAFEYKGCLKPTGMGQVQLPAEIWNKEGEQTYGASDPAAVAISVLSGGNVTGSGKLTWTVAQATIKGSIFYNSYSSLLPGGLPLQGSVLRIPPGGSAERFLSTSCNGCHSVSAKGARLLAQVELTGPSQAFPLAPNTQANPAGMITGPRGAYGALYPDGSVYLSTYAALETAVARAQIAQVPLTAAESALYQTDNGMTVPDTGIPTGTLMPMFSPDGRLLVFNDLAISQAHGLGLMDFDGTTRKATNYRMLFMENDATLRPGWPFFLPDNGAVVFTRTNGSDFSGDGAGLAGLPIGPVSDLYTVDLKTNKVVMLAKAMGFMDAAQTGDDKTYLPYGVEDLHKHYFPTVSPVAAGGYFWVFFDGVRHYGNMGSQRQLWGAAISIAADGDYSVDRSHPAFYLPGQEFGTGNHRAFAALDPCKKDGDSCTSGIDCCGGFCFVPEGNPDDEFGVELPGKCTSDVPECAKTNERCSSNADCCPPEPGKIANSCINGFCAVVVKVM